MQEKIEEPLDPYIDTDKLKNMLTPEQQVFLRLVEKSVDAAIERKFQELFKRGKDAVTFFFSQLGKK